MKNQHLLPTLFVILLTVVLTACDDSINKPAATGSIYDCVVVAHSDAVYQSIQSTMKAPMPCLPQAESYFQLTHVTPDGFSNLYRPARNILEVTIDAGYHQAQGLGKLDVFSSPQAVYRVQAPSDQAFLEWWNQHGNEVRDWFVRQEMARQIAIYREEPESDAVASLGSRMGVEMVIPADFMLIKDTSLLVNGEHIDVVWCCNNKGPKRRDILVYSYPYTSTNTFTTDYLVARRNQVVSRLVSTSADSSYMDTETHYVLPELRQIPGLDGSMKKFYGYELRGLWKMQGGIAMGGPFVSHSRVDEMMGRVITAEAFIYASGQKKRNTYRQTESILYSLLLPEERQLTEEAQE